jgi:hypothetical protein
MDLHHVTRLPVPLTNPNSVLLKEDHVSEPQNISNSPEFHEDRLASLRAYGFVLDQRGPHYTLRRDVPNLRPGQPFPARAQNARQIRAHSFVHAVLQAYRIVLGYDL